MKPRLQLSSPPRSVTMLLTAALFGSIMMLDWITDYELNMGPAYAFAVFIAGWAGGLLPGVILAGVGWYQILHGGTDGTPFFYKYEFFFLVDDANVALALLLIALVSAFLSRRQRDLRDLAHRDPLTGLANRTALFRLIESQIARQRHGNGGFALAYIDCINFKAINDTFGHASGDRLLKEIAVQLNARVRRTDLIARLGGDEFVILMPGGETEGRELVQRIHRELATHFAGTEWKVGFSIGVAHFARPPASADAALHAADQMMYESKRATDGAVHQVVFNG